MGGSRSSPTIQERTGPPSNHRTIDISKSSHQVGKHWMSPHALVRSSTDWTKNPTSARYACIKLIKDPKDDFATYAGRVNRECAKFMLS
ncbi:hypothetical protein ANCDUO_04753 [Ancylostoma duodenale]|uniref:Uncharacterized protein n=1 Tax=Ancylostoma duodenale TaxID=51022 RepID=A0A0C2D5T6_9BILA|nr:hypothetical protein ANCDUO_04753 [Ancylostoma duodenale]